MKQLKHSGVFVVGTGTGVGKTYVSALLIDEFSRPGRKTGYFKAALSGSEKGCDDACYIKDRCLLEEEADFFVPYRYKTAISPHLAGKMEKNPVNFTKIKKAFDDVAKKYDCIVAEGSGGILCPLRFDGETLLLEDVIKMTKLPLIIVATATVGTINHTILTVEYARHHGLSPVGIILNYFDDKNYIHRDNKAMITALSAVPVIATVAAESGKLANCLPPL